MHSLKNSAPTTGPPSHAHSGRVLATAGADRTSATLNRGTPAKGNVALLTSTYLGADCLSFRDTSTSPRAAPPPG
jgi:hypothetical protein